MAGLSRKQITVNGITYAYYERLPIRVVAGEDAPVVVFLHGFTADKTMWMMTVRYLPKEWRIVLLDLPGHGDSSFVQNGDYSPIGMATKLDEVSLKIFNCAKCTLEKLVLVTAACLHIQNVATIDLEQIAKLWPCNST